ncbi:PREDICTED: scarecrow-like protein 6 [Tarenaya hassleriana]|uniref:scarecrow-like protein 6 n=1 Tax=Tarenaya hassleriana TaxID=28532 RepID=UPI00053C4612|nr:PREDICTED: scarecrow-like protein 6 [Tarenaya hassleriana]
MPLPFEEFQGKGVSDFSSSSSSSCSEPLSSLLRCREITTAAADLCYAGGSISEPTSVLDAVRSPSTLTTSSSTLSSSHGGNNCGGGGGGVPAVSVNPAASDEKSGEMGVEEWDNVLPGSPSHEHSILRLIMGDSEDPSIGLNKILQTSTAFQSGPSSEFSAVGFGVLDPGFGLEAAPVSADSLCSSGFSVDIAPTTNPLLPPSVPPLFPTHETFKGLDEKPQVIINQNQVHFTQNPPMFMPVPHGLFQDHNFPVSPPPAKRLNSGPMAPQQEIIEQLFKAAELIESGGDPALLQAILARLNQQLSSPFGKPFQRAAFYFKEALHKLLNNISSPSSSSSYSLIFKIGAYKSFSEISPVLQFANFTSNQALLESFHGLDHVHIIDFDIGYGGQWASLMQELVLRENGPPSLKITVFASPATHDEVELGFTQENLKHFASDINISFEIQVLSLDLLNSVSSWNPPEREAVAVNLSFSNIQSYLPSVLRFVKQVSPTILVCSDRGCERTDLPFPQQLVHSLQSHVALLESIDAVNANLDAMQKIERFLIQPSIEKLVVNRGRSIDRRVPWQAMFMQMGFSPVTHSNFTESQAECLVQRTPVRGFHVEKKQNSLVLCWQRRELVGVSAWRCRC